MPLPAMPHSQGLTRKTRQTSRQHELFHRRLRDRAPTSEQR